MRQDGPVFATHDVLALDEDAYPPGRFDPLNHRDVLHDEVVQLRESGYLVDEFVAIANRTDPTDRAAVLGIVDAMAQAPRRPGWAYEEPEELRDILDAAPRRPAAHRPGTRSLDERTLDDRVLAAWQGRVAGTVLGKPTEWWPDWSRQRIREYLELASAYPLDDYLPVLQPMPAGFAFRESWPETTRGRVDGAARDDDIDYPLLGLHLLERHGAELSTEQIGAAWLELLPVGQVFTAERAAYLNLLDGLRPPATARRRNPWREWIGAQIRADVFGWTRPGDPVGAATAAFTDARLSHTGNGVYGELWAAALVAAAFTAESADEALDAANAVVPSGSRLAEALARVEAAHASGAGWETAIDELLASVAGYHWIHAIPNAVVVAAALRWSDSDPMTAMGRAVMAGLDTDCNGATVGSVMGALHGTAAMPQRLVEPLNDRVRSALFGFDGSRISELAARTAMLARH